jgi:hypothetical protein
MSLLRRIFTNKSNGVPDQYTKLMKVGKKFNISKGQLNKLQVRPIILNEHAESSREVLGVVTSTNIVGQMYKQSQDNINGIMLTLESAAGASIDNFETYANSAALQLVWLKGGTNEATLETTIVQQGLKSMALPGDILNDSWVKTLSPPQNYTDYTFNFEWYQDKEYNKLKYEFILSDGIDTLSFPLVVSAPNSWMHFEVDINAMSDTGTTDKTAITSIGFRCVDKEASFSGYVDDIIAIPPPGSIELKLWNCGSTLPVADGASFDLTNDATQVTELGDLGISGSVVASIALELRGGKRLYHIEDFISGVALEHPNNNLLEVGNYYAITLHYVDTNVSVYGPDTTFGINYYQNGYAFSTSAESVDITVLPGVAGAGAYSDLMFVILSTQDVYLTEYQLHFANAGGDSTSTGSNSSWLTLMEDAGMIITAFTTAHGGHAVVDGTYSESFEWRPPKLDKGGKFEIYYNDDYADGVSQVEFEFFYLYIPPNING